MIHGLGLKVLGDCAGAEADPRRRDDPAGAAAPLGQARHACARGYGS